MRLRKTVYKSRQEIPAVDSIEATVTAGRADLLDSVEAAGDTSTPQRRQDDADPWVGFFVVV